MAYRHFLDCDSQVRDKLLISNDFSYPAWLVDNFVGKPLAIPLLVELELNTLRRDRSSRVGQFHINQQLGAIPGKH
ncbi:hypothetical protein [Roseateles toxinivorans]|uniref:hypothetical protein n=1 Tax=Roseateles toxinivorans TaxID=270368 RepID=UPI00105D8E63|nr:hypothetical protein [Roseateles toxinivorans]